MSLCFVEFAREKKWNAILPFHGRCTHINPLKYDMICTTALHSLISILFNLFVWLFWSLLCIYLDCWIVFCCRHTHFVALFSTCFFQNFRFCSAHGSMCAFMTRTVFFRRTSPENIHSFHHVLPFAIDSHHIFLNFDSFLVFARNLIYSWISCTERVRTEYA